MEKFENNSINQNEREYFKPHRIKSVDFVKGFAICLIILAHAAGVWKKSYLNCIYVPIYRILDVFGPALFIFLSGISVAFTIKRKTGKFPKKAIRNTIFFRGFSIIALGVFYNFISIGTIDVLDESINVPFPLNLWGWNILMFIGFSQIFTYYILKLTRGTRSLIGIAIIIATYWIIPNLIKPSFLGNPIIYILNFIIISPAAHNPIIPYISICFFSSTFGEILMEIEYLETDKAKLDAFNIYMRNGLFFLLAGIILGLIDLEGNYIIECGYKFPLFLYRSEPSNMLYSIGIALLLIGSFYYIIDIKGIENNIMKVFIFYGKVSLSIFLIHYIWLPLYVEFLDIWNIWFFYVGFTAFLGFLMFIWNYQFKGKFSLEWIMGKIKTKQYEYNTIKNKK